MKIAAHPDNIELLRKACQRGDYGKLQPWDMFELISNPCLDRDRPNGRYRLPDGMIVHRDDFTMRTRFIDYGPEDLEWLVMSGIVKECREAYFYVFTEPMFQVFNRFELMPMEPRFLIKNFS